VTIIAQNVVKTLELSTEALEKTIKLLTEDREFLQAQSARISQLEQTLNNLQQTVQIQMIQYDSAK